MKKMAGFLIAGSLAVAYLSACGGGGGGSTAPTAVATPTPRPTPTPEPFAFGAGQHLVGTQIGGGRYYANPNTIGCYWERNSGLGGTTGEIIANDFFGYDPAQVVVDVLGNEVAFTTDADCGNWYTTPRQAATTAPTPGTWVVGVQIPPGTYTANMRSGCYWERVRDFSGGVRTIIANDFVDTAGPRSVTIGSGDVGFTGDDDCGTWSLAQGSAGDVGATSAPMSQADIERNRELRRQHLGFPR
jgi:hypothetical protein